MDPREVPPPPPSAASNMMVGDEPNASPTSMPNSINAMMGHHSTTANTMASASLFPFNSVKDPLSRLFNSRSLFERLPPGLSSGGFNIETKNKKRGRPRKYSPDGTIDLALSRTPVGQGSTSGSPFSEPPAKRKRGRRPGSEKKQLNASPSEFMFTASNFSWAGKCGVGFIPHVILVNPGEDIASKIMSFSKQSPRTICVLSAHGAVCNVTLCLPASSGGAVSYEGEYELISLSGFYLFAEDHGSRRWSSDLSVILAGADGLVHGGVVTGILVAATQVQVIVGSFIVREKKTNSNILKPRWSAAPPQLVNSGKQWTATAASPSSSEKASSHSSDENSSSPTNPPRHLQ